MQSLSADSATEQPGLEQEALHAMIRARSSLVLDHPFFGSLALRLTLKPDPACGDLWTDGVSLAFNPLYASSLPQKKLVAAQAHEIMHIACGHHLRRKDRDERLWNQSCDYAINHILQEAGFSLPEGFLHDPAYADLSVDDIYTALARLQEQNPNGGAENAQETGPGSADAATGTADLGGEQGDEAPSSQNTQSPDAPEGSENGPTGAGRMKESDKEGGKNTDKGKADAFQGEVRDHPATDAQQSQGAQTMAEQEASIALTQAMQRALHMGDMPAGFTRLLRHTLRPTLDWRALLQRFLENCSSGDYSWTTPNRRYLFQDIYLPSLREPQIPELVLAVDSSGSVDEPALAAFCAELSAILDAYDTRLTVLFHDTAVHGSQSFCRQDLPLALTPVGGGGTDYRPVCEYIEEQGISPACLLWFTDLQCNRFPPEPGYPILWVTTDISDSAPPFGDVLRLPPLVFSTRPGLSGLSSMSRKSA